MGKKTADIQQALATFSSHMEHKHSSPDKFMKGIKRLLDSKRIREKKGNYAHSLEKNVIYLYYFVEQAKTILELMIQRVNDDEKFLQLDPGLTLSEVEARVREEISVKKEGFSEIVKRDEFSEIFKKKKAGSPAYIQNLEFNYSYLMAVRSFMVDFINILYALQRECRMEGITPSTVDNVQSYIDMTANYYIGNIEIEEKI